MLATLLENLDDSGPIVTHLHGLAGIGKSTLLKVFAAQAAQKGVEVFRLDARLFEPTAAAFLEELESVAGRPPDQLGRSASRTVILIDAYELLRVLDSWLRQNFIPSLDDSIRLVVASRQPPSAPWLIEPEWQGLFRVIPLGPLDDSESLELLVRRGFSEEEARPLARLAHGHPLTLSLASQLHTGAASLTTPSSGIFERLAQLYLSDVADPITRQAIEASTVVRRVTEPFLAALIPGIDPAALWDQLSRLSFFEPSPSGLLMHDAVREAIGASLNARDPNRHWSYRHAAWRHLRDEAARAALAGQRSRLTLDLVFLLDHPGVREAFFPSAAPPVSIEPAAAEHRTAIFAIAARHDSPEAVRTLASWWDLAPGAFRIARDSAGVIGFYASIENDQATPALAAADPIVHAWLRHLRQEEPLGAGQKVILLRRWLAESAGEVPSPVQAECWLDVKRTYLEMRASLRRCYICLADPAPYADAARFLGFTPVAAASTNFGTKLHHLAMLDFGPGSLDGWISGLLARELESSQLLDADSRHLCVDSQRVPLTGLEFGVLSLLQQQSPKPVTRDRLLAEVWGQNFNGGSNVVDVVVSSLRQKLGSRAGLLTTVRGVGYRFEPPA